MHHPHIRLFPRKLTNELKKVRGTTYIFYSIVKVAILLFFCALKRILKLPISV